MKRLGGFSEGAGPVYCVEYLQDFKGKLHEIDSRRKLNTKGLMLADARRFVVMFDFHAVDPGERTAALLCSHAQRKQAVARDDGSTKKWA
jgi:hypothetical protein